MSECQISGILAMHLHTTRLPMKSTLSCLIACISQGIYAEEPVTEVQRLAPIVVEATRTDRAILETPASAYYLNQEQQNSLNVNLSETLKGVPGLQLNNRENYAQDLQISMRGFGARSTFGVRGVRLYVMVFLRLCQMGRGKPRILT
jgi:Outer membrane receptor for ferrienterochelin and colicins